MPLLQLTVVHAVRPYSCLQFMTTQGLGRFPCSSSSSLVLSLEAMVQYYFQFKHDENFSFCWVKLTEILLFIISLRVSHKSISPFTKLTFFYPKDIHDYEIKVFPFPSVYKISDNSLLLPKLFGQILIALAIYAV